jgi:hypothetical protein
MSNENEKEQIGEELFIEELGEVRGGQRLIPSKLTKALGEDGLSLRPGLQKPIWIVGTTPPKITTMALGEEGTSVPHIIRPMSDE